jgi:ABC-2 type transport system permease protein
VLTGVVEEKSSRVVEVLLARMPARNLLAGKVAGIGLLGLAQLVVTAVAALVATMVVDSVDVPAVSGGVLAWVVAWFVLGYALFAMAFGALGSLASRARTRRASPGRSRPCSSSPTGARSWPSGRTPRAACPS